MERVLVMLIAVVVVVEWDAGACPVLLGPSCLLRTKEARKEKRKKGHRSGWLVPLLQDC